MEKKNKSLTKIEELPLSELFQDFDEYGGRKAEPATLYKIDERKNNDWNCIKKGVIDSQKLPLSEDLITSLYSKYRGKENFRIVIYNSMLPTFPQDILTYRIQAIKKKIALTNEGIEIAKERGFLFGLDEGEEEISRIVSESTGLEIRRLAGYKKHETRYVLGFDKFKVFFPENKLPVSLEEICSNPKSLEQLIIFKFNSLLATFKHELADLNHRKELNNKRSTAEIVSSIWHSSSSETKSIYLLEFNQSQPYFMKWRLQKIEDDYSIEKISSKFHPIGDCPDFIYPTLYLEHGSTKYAGIPYASFGEVLIYGEIFACSVKKLGTKIDSDYYFKRFLNEINEIDIKKDFNRDKENKDTELDELVSDLSGLGLGINDVHENLKKLTNLFFNDEFISSFLLGNVMHDFYCSPYLRGNPPIIGNVKNLDDDMNDLKRNDKILDCVEARQKTNSIWKVLEMDGEKEA
jgi:hypothetical protein